MPYIFTEYCISFCTRYLGILRSNITLSSLYSLKNLDLKNKAIRKACLLFTRKKKLPSLVFCHQKKGYIARLVLKLLSLCNFGPYFFFFSIAWVTSTIKNITTIVIFINFWMKFVSEHHLLTKITNRRKWPL